MTHYEYKVLAPSEAIMEKNLNELGRYGFHVVAVMGDQMGGRVILERQLDDDVNAV